jgi:Flp pilus assembly protein CpaB
MLAAIGVDCLRAERRSTSRLARFGLLDTPAAAAPERPVTANELVRRLGAGLVKRLPPQQQQQLRAALVRAGLAARPGLEEFLGLRAPALVLGAVVGAVLAVAAEVLLAGTPFGLLLPLVVAAGACGYLMPTVVVERMARARRAAIEHALPESLDILVVTLEAGIAFDSAVAFLCERADNPFVDELRRFLSDLSLGRSRREALDAMADPTRSVGVRQVATAVIQAEELGTGMARAPGTRASTPRYAAAARGDSGAAGAHQAAVSLGPVYHAGALHRHHRSGGAASASRCRRVRAMIDTTSKWLLGASAVLALLVGVVVYIAVSANTLGRATATVVVARGDITERTLFTGTNVAALLDVRQVPADTVPRGALRRPEDAIGKTTTAGLSAGKIVLGTPNRLVSSEGEGVRPAASIPRDKVSLTIPANESVVVAGAVQPGDRVDVIATWTGPNGQASAEDLFQGVRVFAVGRFQTGVRQQVAGSLGAADAPTWITLLLDYQQAVMLEYLTRTGGAIAMALRRFDQSGDVATAPVTADSFPRAAPR